MDFSLVPYFSLHHCVLASRQPCQTCRRRSWLIVSCPRNNWSVATAVGRTAAGRMVGCDTRTASYWGLHENANGHGRTTPKFQFIPIPIACPAGWQNNSHSIPFASAFACLAGIGTLPTAKGWERGRRSAVLVLVLVLRRFPSPFHSWFWLVVVASFSRFLLGSEEIVQKRDSNRLIGFDRL
jgi:hypothetical protein